MFNPIFKIKEWWLLRKARKLEQQHVPTNEDIKKEQKQFEFEATELKKMVTKPVQSTTKKK